MSSYYSHVKAVQPARDLLFSIAKVGKILYLCKFEYNFLAILTLLFQLRVK